MERVGNLNNFKVALVKQVTLPDLYVCEKDAPIDDVLFSSMMRIGPIGLFHEYNCDFHIVDIDKSKECNIWKEINRTPIKGDVDTLEELKTKTINMLPGQEFKEPGSNLPNGHFSVNVDSINWQDYDIVISINISIPTRIVLANKSILWCYMLMEPQTYMDSVHFGYDVSFNHHITGLTYFKPGIIDFPYSFIHPELISQIISRTINEVPRKNGIYCDISCSKSEPEEKLVSQAPEHLLELEETGHCLVIHSQNIKENLKKLYHSKYFVKIGGSFIRGNSIIEAISAGCLVIGEANNIIMSNLLPKECRVNNVIEAKQLMQFLENNNEEFLKLYYLQQAMARFFVIDKPVDSLEAILLYKRKFGRMKSSNYSRVKKFIKKIIK